MNKSAVLSKIHEADFFFEKLKESSLMPQKSNETEYYLSAFISAARSFTFTLKKRCIHNKEFPGFEEWYENQLTKFEQFEFSDYFKELRNVTQHEGTPEISGGSIYTNENGEMVSEIYLSHGKGEFKKLKIPSNFIDESSYYLKILVSIYWDFLIDYGEKLDPWRVHTLAYLEKNDLKKNDLIYSQIENFQETYSKELESNNNFINSKPHYRIDKLIEKYLVINRFKT